MRRNVHTRMYAIKFLGIHQDFLGFVMIFFGLGNNHIRYFVFQGNVLLHQSALIEMY